jgi:hypothetical protein
MTLHDELLTAEMNEAYYRWRCGRLTTWDRWSRVLSSLAGAATVAALVAREPQAAPWLAALATLITVLSSSFQWADRARTSQDLATRWSMVMGRCRNEILLNGSEAPPSQELLRAVDELQGKDVEPADTSKLNKLHAEVMVRHGLVFRPT